jgi:hypothetical protein
MNTILRLSFAVTLITCVVPPRTALAGGCESCTSSAYCETIVAPALCVRYASGQGCPTDQAYCCPGQGCRIETNGRPSCEPGGCVVVEEADSGTTGSGGSGSGGTNTGGTNTGGASAGGSAGTSGGSAGASGGAGGASSGGAGAARASGGGTAAGGGATGGASGAATGGQATTGGAMPTSDAGPPSAARDEGSCSCRVPGKSSDESSALALLLAFSMGIRRLRRPPL